MNFKRSKPHNDTVTMALSQGGIYSANFYQSINKNMPSRRNKQRLRSGQPEQKEEVNEEKEEKKEVKEEAKEEAKEEEEEEVKEIKDEEDWPGLAEREQFQDPVTKKAFIEGDQKLFEALMLHEPFLDILNTLHIPHKNGGIFNKLMFHPLRKRLIFTYNFSPLDIKQNRHCCMCHQLEPHKLVIEVTRRSQRVSVYCVLDRLLVRKFPRMRLPVRIAEDVLNASELQKAEFLHKAFRVGRTDATLEVWDEYSVFDPYTFSDFMTELAFKYYGSEEEILLFAATRINRVLAFIPPDTYNVKKSITKDLFYPSKGLPKFSARYYSKLENGKTRVCTMGSQKIIDGLMSKGVLRLYQGKDVIPQPAYPERKRGVAPIPPRNFLNVWTGFQVERAMKEEKMRDGIHIRRVDISPIIEFLRDWICAGDKGIFAALMKFFVELLSCPWTKVPWIIWMYTPEKRMGKGLLCDFLYNCIFGSMTMKKFNGMNEILATHNAWCEGKKLVVVEECSSAREDFFSGWDKIKSWGADRVISVHRKYENQYDAVNLLSIMIISNHRNSLVLEPGDRRYLCVNPIDSKGGKKRCAYFKELQKQILREEMGIAFFDYCCRTTEFDHIDPYHTDPPLNALKEQILEENLGPEYLFISEMATLRWRARLQGRIEEYECLLPLVDKEIQKREQKEEKEEVLPPDYDPVDLLDPFEDEVAQPIMGNAKARAWAKKQSLKLPTLNLEALTKLKKEWQKWHARFLSLLEVIGNPEAIPDPTESNLVKSMYTIGMGSNIVSSAQLYATYLAWFAIRVSEGKGKTACPNITFGKRMSQCMKPMRNQTHLEKRARAYNLDTVNPMYIPFTQYEDTIAILESD